MPSTELCVVHPGGLSASSWTRLASHLPAGTPVKVLELEAVNAYWADDPALTVDALAEHVRARVEPAPERVLVGWGFGGVVAEALAARLPDAPRRVVVLDAPAPGALEAPDEALLLRSFAMYLGARRGRGLTVDPARLDEGVEPALAHLAHAAIGAGALREQTSIVTLRALYAAHTRRLLRDHRLAAGHAPAGEPLTVVKAVASLLPASPALGWDRFGPVELLVSGGDHYSMLTEPAPAVHLAMLLQRWLRPVCAAV
jgi:thioesterase domain-containing protein